MKMSANTKPAASLNRCPLADRQLEMAHAVDTIDQALGKLGLTWSWLAQMVTGGVARHAQRHGAACQRMLPPTTLDLSIFFREWARKPHMRARDHARSPRKKLDPRFPIR
jgi:hypothetical protein